MSLTLTPEIEAKIRDRVDSGRYGDAADVISAALRLLEERERSEHLNALLAVGLAQAKRGELVEFTPEWVADLERRVEERMLIGEAGEEAPR